MSIASIESRLGSEELSKLLNSKFDNRDNFLETFKSCLNCMPKSFRYNNKGMIPNSPEYKALEAQFESIDKLNINDLYFFLADKNTPLLIKLYIHYKFIAQNDINGRKITLKELYQVCCFCISMEMLKIAFDKIYTLLVNNENANDFNKFVEFCFDIIRFSEVYLFKVRVSGIFLKFITDNSIEDNQYVLLCLYTIFYRHIDYTPDYLAKNREVSSIKKQIALIFLGVLKKVDYTNNNVVMEYQLKYDIINILMYIILNDFDPESQEYAFNILMNCEMSIADLKQIKDNCNNPKFADMSTKKLETGYYKMIKSLITSFQKA